MRNPNTLNEVISYTGNNTIITFDHFPEYDIQDWDFNDEKDMKKYFKTVESLVRTSFHYTEMIAYMKNYMNMNKCSIFKNVAKVNRSKISIHIHHDPFDLYNICLIVFRKRRELGESLSERMVAKEVMWLHYSAMIGLIPLCQTVHELVHNKYLFIPTTKVMGRYKEFVEMYKPFMLQEQLEMLDTIEQATLEFESSNYQDLLERHYIYIDISSSIELPKYDEIMKSLSDRIDYLKSHPTQGMIPEQQNSVPPLQISNNT